MRGLHGFVAKVPNLARRHIDHVVMGLSRFQSVDFVQSFERMAAQKAAAFEVQQDAADRGKANVITHG